MDECIAAMPRNIVRILGGMSASRIAGSTLPKSSAASLFISPPTSSPPPANSATNSASSARTSSGTSSRAPNSPAFIASSASFLPSAILVFPSLRRRVASAEIRLRNMGERSRGARNAEITALAISPPSAIMLPSISTTCSSIKIAARFDSTRLASGEMAPWVIS